MKNYFPVIALGAAALGVVYWLRKKASAGNNLQYEFQDIAIDSYKIVESGYKKIYFNLKLKLINVESVSVNIKNIDLNVNVGQRQLGKIYNSTKFVIPAKSSKTVKIETSFTSGQILLYIVDLIKEGFKFNDPISVNGFINTDLGKVNINYTKNPRKEIDAINGFYKSYDVVYKTKGGKSMIYKNIQAKSIKEAKEVVNSLMKESNSFNGVVSAFLNGVADQHILNNVQGNC